MWTKREEGDLIILYPNMFNIDIANILGKTKSQIDNKAHRLGIKKSKLLLTNVSKFGNQKRIEMGGRNLTFENLKGIALKYKTRIDFIHGDGPAYQSARLKGYLDDICSHMTIVKFSIPQLILREITDAIFEIKCSYNNRKILSPYEIDVYYEEFNLGFEFQGIAWHLNNKNDKIKEKMANDKGVFILYINELEGSRNYEKDIKEQLINKLALINSITNKKITKTKILKCKIKNIYLELYNKEDLILIAKSYTSFSDFLKNERSVYRKLCKMKLIDGATSHMNNKKINKHNYSEEDIYKKINQYDNLTDFRKNELQLYKHIKRVKLDTPLEKLKPKKTFTEDEIINCLSKYKTKCNFISNNKKMYKFIRRNKCTHLLKSLADCRKKLVD